MFLGFLGFLGQDKTMWDFLPDMSFTNQQPDRKTISYFIRFIYLFIYLFTYLLTERATGLGRRTKEEFNIEKWDQTESPEIPDRGETSEIPGLPSGGNLELLLLLFIVGLYYSPVNRSGSP